MTIGGQNGTFWNRNLNGKIDEVRISSNVRYTSNFIPSTSFDSDAYTKALYDFNEGIGSVVNDLSGNGNNGTIYGATWSSDVPPSQTNTNYSLKLNWNNALTADRIDVPFSSSINSYFDTQKLTISLWYKPLGEHTGWNWYLRKSIGGCQDDFAFGHSTHQPGDYSYLMFGNARSCTGDQFLEIFDTGMQIGQWYHLELNYDVLIGRTQIFINGVLRAESNSFSNITANEIVTYILFGMNGLADEMHFSNSIRHTQNFTPNYEEVPDQNTIFLFNMNEGDGNILIDASDNHNNANIIDPNYVEGWSTDVPPILAATWQAEITVVDAGGLDASKTLTFGQDPTASDSLDEGLGEVELPPLPPPTIFDARFEFPTNSPIYSYIDLRNDTLTAIDWELLIQGDYPINICWSPDSLPEGLFYLVDGAGGLLVNVNMKTDSCAAITNNALSKLFIKYGRQNNVVVNVDSGWNIISAPVLKSDMQKDSYYPGNISNAYKYIPGGGYTIMDSLSLGSGYWMKFVKDTSYSLTGLNHHFRNEIQSGWNMIGPFDFTVLVSNITTEPPGIISSNFFGYNNGYNIEDILLSGKGYWVKASLAGKVVLDPSILVKQSENNFASISDEWGKILIEDANGKSTTLYVSHENISLELPPPPPVGIFDARFTTGNLVEDIYKESKQFKFSTCSYPVTVSVEGIQVTLKDLITGDIINKELKSGDQIVIADSRINILMISGNPTDQIPLSYELNQNYPNPFNPITIIKFAVPKESNIDLSIYNVLGELVLTIVNEQLKPGYYEYEFNASSLASGVYLYRIKAGSFVETKKMIFLK